MRSRVPPRAGKARGHRIVTSPVEHHAVGHTLRYLERFGFEIVEVPVADEGRADLDQPIADRPSTTSAIMLGQQRGRASSDAEIERVRGHKGVLLAVDAVQGAPYIDLDALCLDIDLLSIAAHSSRVPRGRRAVPPPRNAHPAQQQGGEQERHRRAGTENVAAAVGLAAAYELSCDERAETVKRSVASASGFRRRSSRSTARS